MTIRRQPSDFLVKERPSAAFVGSLRERAGGAPAATHAVYELTKESMSTPEAMVAFARAVGGGLRPGEVDYAGLKDKHARTVQMVSVQVDGGAELAREVNGREFSARLLGWSERAVSADVIEGNGFEIVVRDLSEKASAEMGRRAGLLSVESERGAALLVVNYFGAQRFGSARHGQGFAAARLLRGDFEGALKLLIGTPARKDSGKTRRFTRLCAAKWGAWKELVAELPKCPERRAVEALAGGGDFRQAFAALPHFTQQMCVEAFQSHLWNAAARRIVRTWDGLLRADDEFGEMLFPAAAAVDEHWRAVQMPVLGPKTVLHEPWGPSAAGVLAEEGIKQEGLRIHGLRRPFFGEAERWVFVTAHAFEMGPPEPDDLGGGKRLKRTVRFELPRGAYATVVLRALGQ